MSKKTTGLLFRKYSEGSELNSNESTKGSGIYSPHSVVNSLNRTGKNSNANTVSALEANPNHATKKYKISGVAASEATLSNQVRNKSKSIIDKYKKGGIVKKMLAPKGEISNLNKAEWDIVRTSYFKDWFSSYPKYRIRQAIEYNIYDIIEKYSIKFTNGYYEYNGMVLYSLSELVDLLTDNYRELILNRNIFSFTLYADWQYAIACEFLYKGKTTITIEGDLDFKDFGLGEEAHEERKAFKKQLINQVGNELAGKTFRGISVTKQGIRHSLGHASDKQVLNAVHFIDKLLETAIEIGWVYSKHILEKTTKVWLYFNKAFYKGKEYAVMIVAKQPSVNGEINLYDYNLEEIKKPIANTVIASNAIPNHYGQYKNTTLDSIYQTSSKNIYNKVDTNSEPQPEYIKEYEHINKSLAKGGVLDSDQKEVYTKWKKLVNMSPSELKKFYDSEEGKDAGLSGKEADKLGIHSGRESARWILKMKDIPHDKWTPEMWKWAKRQNSFISRMSGNKGSLYDDKGKKTRKHTSLLIWGHNPEKYEEGGTIVDTNKANSSTMAKKAYLMTQEDYLQEVVPVLKAYKDFLKKNKYFVYIGYGNVVSYPELVGYMERKEDIGHIGFKKDDMEDLPSRKYMRHLLEKYGKKTMWEADTVMNEEEKAKWRKLNEEEKEQYGDVWEKFDTSTREQRLDKAWTQGQADAKKNPSKEIIEQKNEFIKQLRDFYGDKYFESSGMSESENLKTNKRVIKFAIDYEIYKKLLDDGLVDIADLQKYAISAGTKIPQKLNDKSAVVRENLYKEIYESMPSINRDILEKLVEDIKVTFQPLADIIYERETTKYFKIIPEFAAKETVTAEKLGGMVEFYHKVFNIGKQETKYRDVGLNKHGRMVTESYTEYSQLTLKPDWKETVIAHVLKYIEQLKAQFIRSIVVTFEKITLPIKSFKQLELRVNYGGFQGEYKFEFENGSSFILKTQAIVAGGHNIQIMHLRYLVDYVNATLADGSKVSNPSLANIILNFSDKAETQKLTNPYLLVENAGSLMQIIEALYKFCKGNYNFKNVRKYDSKDDVSLSFEYDRYAKDYKTRTWKHGFALKKDLSLEDAKKKAVLFLDENQAEKPKEFKEGGAVKEEKEEIGGNYHFDNGMGSFTSITVFPLDRNLMATDKYFTVLVEVRAVDKNKVTHIQRKPLKTYPIEQYEAFMADLKERGARKLEKGGDVSDYSKVASASSRFKPKETIFFNPPLVGKNGAKLTSYTWRYEWMEDWDNFKGETVNKRVSDWNEMEISADTGRGIVHQYTVEMPDGTNKTVSAESVPVLLGYVDRKELKSFPNLVTASKTLAKQQMQLAIMEAQEKEYNELQSKFEKEPKPEIIETEYGGLPFVRRMNIDKDGDDSSITYFSMGDATFSQGNPYNYSTGKYTKIHTPTKDTIDYLQQYWVSNRLKEAGVKRPYGLYDLRNRIERQKRKLSQILAQKDTMEHGGSVTMDREQSLAKMAQEQGVSLHYLKNNRKHIPIPEALRH